MDLMPNARVLGEHSPLSFKRVDGFLFNEMDEAVDVLELLGDAYARCIIAHAEQRPMSPRELEAACDAHHSTIYRRINQLQEHDLLTESKRMDPDGHHHSVYETNFERLTVSVSEGKGHTKSISNSKSDPSIAWPISGANSAGRRKHDGSDLPGDEAVELTGEPVDRRYRHSRLRTLRQSAIAVRCHWFFPDRAGAGLEGLLTEFTDMDLYQASLIHAALTLTGLMSVIYSLCDGNLKEFTP